MFQLHGFRIGRNVKCIHKIFHIRQQTYKEDLCAGIWIRGFKVKVDQDISGLCLRQASNLVSTDSWPQEAREIIVGLGSHAGPWAAQAWPLGADFPPLQPCWKAGQLAMFSREVRSLGIYVQSTDFNVSHYSFLPEKHIVRAKSPPQCAGFSLQSMPVFISGLELGVQWGWRGI